MVKKEDACISGDLARHVFMLVFLGWFWLFPWVYKTAVALREANRKESNYYTSPAAQALLFIFVPFYSIYWFYKTASAINVYAYRCNAVAKIVGLCTFTAFFTNLIPAVLIQMEIERLVSYQEGKPTPAADKGSNPKSTTAATAPTDAKAPAAPAAASEMVTPAPEKITPPPTKAPVTADDGNYDYDEDCVRRIQPDGFDKGGFAAVEMQNAPWMPVTDHDEGTCPVCGRQVVTLQTSGNYIRCSGCHIVLKVMRGAIMFRDSERRALEKHNKIAIQDLKRAKRQKRKSR